VAGGGPLCAARISRDKTVISDHIDYCVAVVYNYFTAPI
jgi:hypothetical protein